MALLIDLIAGHDARHRIILGSAAGAVVFFFLRHSPLSTDIIAAWDTFAFCVLFAAWLTILITPQRMLRATKTRDGATRSAHRITNEAAVFALASPSKKIRAR